MLLSLLIPLTATNRHPILGPLGRPAQAWFLGQLTRAQPEFAEALHDDGDTKPYTVSTLLNDRGLPLKTGTWLENGQPAWLRITAIGEKLSEIILKKVVKNLPNRVTLYKMDFRLDGWTCDRAQHAWAGQTSFEALAQDPSFSRVDRTIRMEFASPTAFRSSSNDIALPIPAHVFRSLFQKWNAFCPEAMQVQDIWPAFVESCILVHELTGVNTVQWKFAEGTRGGATGFTGTVGFHLLPKSKIPEKWIPYWDGAAAVMQSLGRFAFYSGVGHHTTIGLGQTRQIPNVS